jgi:hypothetical protein
VQRSVDMEDVDVQFELVQSVLPKEQELIPEY